MNDKKSEENEIEVQIENESTEEQIKPEKSEENEIEVQIENESTEEQIKPEKSEEEILEDKFRQIHDEQGIDALINKMIHMHKEITELKEQKDDYLGTSQRVQANFENYKKKVSKDIEFSNRNTKIQVLKTFFSLYDDLERALGSMDKNADPESIVAGLKMIFKNLQFTFESLNIDIIAPSKGKFDPRYHEAIHVIENDEYEDNQIVELFTKGFKMDDKVIRPAKVIIAKKSTKQNNNQKENQNKNQNQKVKV